MWFYTSNRVLMVVWRDGSSDPVVNNLVKNEKFRCVLFVSTFFRVLSRCITLSNVIAFAGVVYCHTGVQGQRGFRITCRTPWLSNGLDKNIPKLPCAFVLSKSEHLSRIMTIT